jgi:hypothetical protein
MRHIQSDINSEFPKDFFSYFLSDLPTPYPALGKAFNESQNMTCLCLPDFTGSQYDPPQRLLGIAIVIRHMAARREAHDPDGQAQLIS